MNYLDKYSKTDLKALVVVLIIITVCSLAFCVKKDRELERAYNKIDSLYDEIYELKH